MPLVEANGVRLHVQQLGTDGPPVVLLHGLMLDTLSTWYFTAGPVLARTHRVLMLDWRGHGLSEQVDTGFGLGSLAADVAAVADGFAPGEPVSVAGFSYGGAVALRLASDDPERVRSLAVVDTPLPVMGDGGMDLLERALVEEPWDLFLELLPEGQRAVFAADTRRRRRRAATMVRLYRHTAMRAEMLAERDIPDERLGRITCPVLLAYAERSWYGETRDRLARVLPGSRVEMFDSGHLLPLERPAELAASLARFLDG